MNTIKKLLTAVALVGSLVAPVVTQASDLSDFSEVGQVSLSCSNPNDSSELLYLSIVDVPESNSVALSGHHWIRGDFKDTRGTYKVWDNTPSERRLKSGDSYIIYDPLSKVIMAYHIRDSVIEDTSAGLVCSVKER